jgi:cytochrome c-type biogenesis protein CcmH
MIWLWMLLLALLALAPLGWAVWRPRAVRGRREADLALYRSQLVELDADLAAGRLDAAGHAAAKLEVQRRLLATPDATAPVVAAGNLSPRMLAPLLAVPVVALGLYAATGTPDMPSAPFSLRQQTAERDDALLAQLRARLAQMPARSDQARQGWMMLGNAERNRGRLDAAAEAYRHALAAGFDADATAQLAQLLLEEEKPDEAATLLAEALPRAPQHIGLRFLSGAAELSAGRADQAKTIWRALVADSPEGAPWRAMVQRRLDSLP